MVTLLAKNAVKIKSGFENAKMTGNYECAYALGLLSYLSETGEMSDFDNVIQLKKEVLEKAKEYIETKEKDKNVEEMLRILKEYDPSDSFDEQMVELYKMGYADQKL